MSFPSDIREQIEQIQGIAAQLRGMGRAFSQTGNIEMSISLCGASADLLAATRKIDELVSARIDGDFKNAMQTSANLLNAALAGVKVGQESKDS